MRKIYFVFTVLIISVLAGCNHSSPKAPDGMVFIKGGTTLIGADNGFPNERPVHKMKIKSFYMDISPITVAQFRKFIEATGYKTDAEKFGNSGVFSFTGKKWEMINGANWEYPQGPGKPKAIDDHPVTQVSWYDAEAYAKWADKRLPTEFEFEYASRKGVPENQLYTWGKKLDDAGGYHANVWEGKFPYYNDTLDGFLMTSPVGYFGKNGLGLTDIGGNVWEWCSNVFKPYKNSPDQFPVDNKIKALRCGSFLCDSTVCHGYKIGHRNFCSAETSLMHTGFRCAKDAV